ncbi:hypothetical protein [Microbispora sp. NPDC049633]
MDRQGLAFASAGKRSGPLVLASAPGRYGVDASLGRERAGEETTLR